jgi:hypothetical protein
MVSSRYSAQEMKQWHDASCEPQDAPRAKAARGAMAKGQADARMNRTANARDAKHRTMPSQRTGADDWARECLFDCYNG